MSKRLFDIVISLVALIGLFPALLLIALVVAASGEGGWFFRQVRAGRGGRPFVMIKFRTMLDFREQEKIGFSDSELITPIGKFLRNSSLDELPELWNVLKGEMSLVGPRPLLMEYLPLYTSEQARRHEVKPGITGWAQVNGRNSISWEEKFKLDVWYVDNRSFLLDLKIIGLTICKVLKRDGISAPGEATMYRFTGSGGKENTDV